MSSASIAVSLLAHLPGWTIAAERFDDQPFTELARADGATIMVCVDRWIPKGRVEFSGRWPRFADGSQYHDSKPIPRISCSASRGAKVLAREITRRLLPDYEAAYAEAIAYVRQHDAAADEAGNVAARLVSALGTDAKLGENKSRKGDGVTVWCQSMDSVRRIRVDPASPFSDRPLSVSFEVHDLDPAAAFEVLKTIQVAEARARNPERIRVDVPAESVDQLVDDEVEEISQPKLMRVS